MTFISMKKYYFFLIMMMSLMLTLKAQQPQTAIEMNDYLVGVIAGIHDAGANWGNKYVLADSTKEYHSLKSTTDEITVLIDQKIVELNALTDIGGSEEFRKSIIDFLYYEKQMITEAFTPFNSLTSESTQEEKDAMFNNLTELTKTEDSKLDSIRDKQAAYASANNFTISDDISTDYDNNEDLDDEYY
jgi:hypothetical protein